MRLRYWGEGRGCCSIVPVGVFAFLCALPLSSFPALVCSRFFFEDTHVHLATYSSDVAPFLLHPALLAFPAFWCVGLCPAPLEGRALTPASSLQGSSCANGPRTSLLDFTAGGGEGGGAALGSLCISGIVQFGELDAPSSVPKSRCGSDYGLQSRLTAGILRRLPCFHRGRSRPFGRLVGCALQH